MKSTIRSKLKLASLVTGVGAATIATTPAFAQQSRIMIEEIVITAQHRAQNIQDVPITVTAISAEELEAGSIFDIGSIAYNVPGMTLGEFAPGQALISLRGVGSVDDGAGLDNSVAVFLDGIYMGRSASTNFDMFDLERIEVLKGPQGTLFGRNAIGGAINVITAKPTDETNAKVAVTAGSEGILRYQGLISGGLADDLAGKIVINHREHDGYVRNKLLKKDVQDEDYSSIRGQLMWVTDQSEWLLNIDHMEDDRGDIGRAPIVNGVFDYVGTAVELGAGRPGTTASPTSGFNKREVTGISITGDIEFDTGKVTSITGVRNTETDWEMPSVGAPLGGGFDLAAGVFGSDVIDDVEEEIDTFSQEFRWTSELSGKFNYVVGLYYFTEDTDRQEQFRIDQNTTATGQIVTGNEWTRTENETTSYAVYSQGSWEFNEQWKLTLGARYTIDERDYVASATNCGLTDAEILGAGFSSTSNCVFGGNRVGSSLDIIAEAFVAPASDDWSDFSPMISLQYRQNDHIMYFSTISTGFKSGGFAGSQGIRSAATNPVDPENVTNFELGFKGDFLDNTLRINGTAFIMDYEDLQVVRFGPVPNSDFGTFQTTNIGSADISGLEMDFTWYATDRFRISGNYSYLDTEANDLILEGFDGSTDFSGLPLRQAPENSYSLTLNYTLPTTLGEYDFRLQYNHMDEQHFDFASIDDTISPDHDLVNARVTWNSNDEKYSVALWGQNIGDEEYVSHSYRIGPGSIGVWGAPATYGVTGTISY